MKLPSRCEVELERRNWNIEQAIREKNPFCDFMNKKSFSELKKVLIGIAGGLDCGKEARDFALLSDELLLRRVFLSPSVSILVSEEGGI